MGDRQITDALHHHTVAIDIFDALETANIANISIAYKRNVREGADTAAFSNIRQNIDSNDSNGGVL
ncbi:hypothetical protein [Agrobacterium fabrum]|uniref:hypothetical protein n=1 Tax=Agrobacterium fabrum TaxID=1176649 RepID=UPI00215754E1|nr:hypothetical protein [Agrobacterium fabrum]MCR6722800.1 hypothetical protein [Agrobacterium fabrum]